MEEDTAGVEPRFSLDEIKEYLFDGRYPHNFDKEDKHALRKIRAKYFTLKDGSLYYIGAGSTKPFIHHTSYIVRSHRKQKERS